MARTLTREDQEAIERVIRKFYLLENIERAVSRLNLNDKWILEWELRAELRGKISFLLRILTKKFEVLPENLIENIRTVKDAQVIDSILDDIFEISSLEELEKYLND